MRHYIGGTEDTNQRWDYSYDANTVDSTFTANNLWGRLAAVQFGSRQTSNGRPGYYYEYSYSAAGRVTGQRMQAWIPTAAYDSNGNPTYSASAPLNLDHTYAWDNEGRLTAMQDPIQVGTQGEFTYQFDVMGRLSTLQETTCGTCTRVTDASATYGPANSNIMGSLGGNPNNLAFPCPP